MKFVKMEFENDGGTGMIQPKVEHSFITPLMRNIKQKNIKGEK